MPLTSSVDVVRSNAGSPVPPLPATGTGSSTWPSGGRKPRITGSTKLALALQPSASVAVTVNEAAPGASGTPASEPPAVSATPAGNAPPVSANAYGASPPLAESSAP
jgi:hypothetical protein